MARPAFCPARTAFIKVFVIRFLFSFWGASLLDEDESTVLAIFETTWDTATVVAAVRLRKGSARSSIILATAGTASSIFSLAYLEANAAHSLY